MINRIFSATGCARCNITKKYLKENGIDYQEYDIKADGKDAFAKFYRANRPDIYRDKDGVEFPVFTDGQVIRQGVSSVIGYLIAGKGLDGFFDRNTLHGEWIDGFNISGGDPSRLKELLQVLSYLKKNGLHIELTTDGGNPEALKAVHEKGLGDRVIMEVKGPAGLYPNLANKKLEPDKLKQSINLTARFPEYRFHTTVAPMILEDGAIRYLSPDEIAETARFMEAATGSKKHPYELRPFDPGKTRDERLKGVEPLPANALFKYRTAARRYMVMTEIAK